ncbi:3-oxoacyl-(acyl-carrier-protein) synthase [Prochlorococcus sp. MIT 0602]|nr:3-oxoacyl-(acyl-carrier-protein) synthase [Prochlorococcus sp. MIT 0602]
MSLVGSGSATPAQKITNDEMALRVETNDEWVRTRTGIRARRIIGPEESLTSLCVNAAQSALDMAGWNAESVDMVLVATSTPDDLFGMAPKVQGELGAINSVAFDLTAACSGFLFAFVTAAQFLKNGSFKRALIIGADQLSGWMDWNDRSSCVLFGDGAGAIAIEATVNGSDSLIGFKVKSDGARGDCLNLHQKRDFVPLLGSYQYQKGGFSNVQMNGQEVYKFAVREVPSLLKEVLETYGVPYESIDWLLLHQANQRILNAVADRFSIPYHKVLSNLEHYGNTSAGTIPIMLDEAVRDGRIQPGNLIAASGFGAGLSWGVALFRWDGPS